jgi:hypothetical protein
MLQNREYCPYFFNAENITIVTKHLIGNVAAITASRELKLVAEQVTDTPIPTGTNKDKELRLDASLAPRADGKISGSAGVYIRDGDFAASVGWNSGFSEGFDKLQKFITAAGERAPPPPPEDDEEPEAHDEIKEPRQEKEPPVRDKQHPTAKENRLTAGPASLYEERELVKIVAKEEQASTIENMNQLKPPLALKDHLENIADKFGGKLQLSKEDVAVLKHDLGKQAEKFAAKTKEEPSLIAKIFDSVIPSAEASVAPLAIETMAEMVLTRAIALKLLARVIIPGGVVIITAWEVGQAIYKYKQEHGTSSEDNDDDLNGDILYRKNRDNADRTKSDKLKQKLAGGYGTPQFDPDDDEHKERKFNVKKADSPVWKELDHFRDDIKTNGLSGKDKRYYEWDYTHNDIEVYDRGGRIHLGSINPITGDFIKKARDMSSNYKDYLNSAFSGHFIFIWAGHSSIKHLKFMI